MSRVTRSQAKGIATQKARAAARFHIVRDCSRAGESKEVAARRASLTLSGLNSMLDREIGSQIWPIKEET